MNSENNAEETKSLTYENLYWAFFCQAFFGWAVLAFLICYFLGIEVGFTPKEEFLEMLADACKHSSLERQVGCWSDMGGGQSSFGNWAITKGGIVVVFAGQAFYSIQSAGALAILPLAAFWGPGLFFLVPGFARGRAESKSSEVVEELVTAGWDPSVHRHISKLGCWHVLILPGSVKWTDKIESNEPIVRDGTYWTMMAIAVTFWGGIAVLFYYFFPPAQIMVDSFVDWIFQ